MGLGGFLGLDSMEMSSLAIKINVFNSASLLSELGFLGFRGFLGLDSMEVSSLAIQINVFNSASLLSELLCPP